jgi:acetyl-CoA carboxylase biotin carboxyl carrier protein
MKRDNPTELNELVRSLADILKETGLTEIEYGNGDWHVRVSKTPAPVAALAAGAQIAGPLAAPPGAPAEAAPAGEQLANHPGVVVSPMVGIAYTMPEPGAAPFVQVGDRIKAGDTLLLIEAMKVFNPIKAPRAGTVTRILATNGSPVEFGEPLMIIE